MQSGRPTSLPASAAPEIASFYAGTKNRYHQSNFRCFIPPDVHEYVEIDDTSFPVFG
jgi:hypothetical protein